MISLTRLNNQRLLLNSDLIKWVENAPDTVLTLVSGEKVIVRETAEQILDAVTSFRRTILQGLTVNSDELLTKQLPAPQTLEQKPEQT